MIQHEQIGDPTASLVIGAPVPASPAPNVWSRSAQGNSCCLTLGFYAHFAVSQLPLRVITAAGHPFFGNVAAERSANAWKAVVPVDVLAQKASATVGVHEADLKVAVLKVEAQRCGT